MKKNIVSTLFLVMLSSSLVNAEDSKKMTDEELIAKIMQLDKREQVADVRIVEAKEKTLRMKEKTKDLEKLEKTVDKLAKTLQVDK